jgi:hypothetical protein
MIGVFPNVVPVAADLSVALADSDLVEGFEAVPATTDVSERAHCVAIDADEGAEVREEWRGGITGLEAAVFAFPLLFGLFEFGVGLVIFTAVQDGLDDTLANGWVNWGCK